MKSEVSSWQLQQFFTNEAQLQSKIGEGTEISSSNEVKLLGLKYDRIKDTLSTADLHLSKNANTKRLILSTIASNFDLFQFAGAIINRAGMFIHKLQCSKSLSWDDRISPEFERMAQHFSPGQ